MISQDFPYEVLEEFSRGGCSIIYKVKSHEREDKKQYVLKTMSAGEGEEDDKRFYMEYEFLRAYPHPNLIEVREYFNDWHGRPAYVMEWVEGDTWQNFWRDRKVLEEIPTFLHLFKQLCEGLDFIHKHQIVHRDLKPQNILISNDQEVKIIDFGIMKVADLTMYTQRNTFMGSAYYVAPEGVADEVVNHTADIFSMGVILYDLFTGMKPFQGHTLGETIYQRLVKKPRLPSEIAEAPESLDPLLLKMLEREPRNRQQSCSEVFREMEAVFGKYQPEPPPDDTTEIDILTKEPLLHRHFLTACESFLDEKNLLYLVGDEGSGKTTIVENLAGRLDPESMIKLDCRTDTHELEVMEAVLRNVHVSTTHNKRLVRWREILGNALPSLQWNDSGEPETMDISTTITAFGKVLLAIKERTVIIIEDIESANPSLLQFLRKMAVWVNTRSNAKIFLILTTTHPNSELGDLVVHIHVPFPDAIVLNDYLNYLFPDCRIPLELTEALVVESGKNINDFLRLVNSCQEQNQLRDEDGVLVMEELEEETEIIPEPEEQTANAIPVSLTALEPDQISLLETIALCPEGIGLDVLKAVSGLGMKRIGRTLDHAAKAGVLEYQASMTDAFRWKDSGFQAFLVNSLEESEKNERYLAIAHAIESEAGDALDRTPQLWLSLCRLYQRTGDDVRASDYGLRYARYCLQNARYEPIRKILGQFLHMPQLQKNQEIWSMLALAYREEDTNQAVFFAKKALAIEDNIEGFALMAIVEYQAQDERKALEYVRRMLISPELETLGVHFLSPLIQILVNLGQQDGVETLREVLEEKLRGRDDLFAVNTLVLAHFMSLQPRPKDLIEALTRVEVELLPRTYRKLNMWAGLCYLELFQYQKALASLKCLDHGGMTDPRYFRDLLFLYLNFGKINEIKSLISVYGESKTKAPGLEVLQSLFDLVTELLVHDPKVYRFPHISKALINARVEKSSWLALILTRLDPSLIELDLITPAIKRLELASVPLARHQLPRFRVLHAIKNNEPVNLTHSIQDACDKAHARGLVMEKLRLFILQDELKRNGLSVGRIDFHFEPGFLESPAAFQFTKLPKR